MDKIDKIRSVLKQSCMGVAFFSNRVIFNTVCFGEYTGLRY